MKSLFLFVCSLSLFATAEPIAEQALAQGQFLSVTLPQDLGGRISEFRIKSAAANLAGELGLLNEGFGIASPYIPSRRVNEKLEQTAGEAGAVTWLYSYDCEGPNIDGLHVIRTIQPLADEASLRVVWRIENKGNQSHWIAPWVRNDAAPGGVFSANDRLDIPTTSGLHRARRSGYYPAARNWIAATSPAELTTLYGVFNADQTHSFLGVFEEQKNKCEFQTCFVPRLLNPGDAWETTYRINAVRGLKRVDFASEEIAAQLDYAPGKLVLLISSVKPMSTVSIYASVVGANGRRWKLSPKKFDAAPDRVVRCTFEWTAPTEGTYDFLAQFKGPDGKPLELNKQMATPHGGIDTQFTVGNSESTSLAAWTDAPYALERGSRVLSRALVTQTPAAVWIESPLEKIFPNDTVKLSGTKSTVEIALARNERESFQIGIRPPKDAPLDDVRFLATDLIGPAGSTIPASNIEIFSVRNYPVKIPSFYEGPTGEHPDALVPYKPFQAPADRSTPVWFTVYAPPGIGAGQYKGTITMSASGAPSVTIDLQAEVFDFELPVTPHLKTDFVYFPEYAQHWAQKNGCTLSASALTQRYADTARDHRITLRAATELPGPGGWNDPARLEAFAKECLAKGATTFSVSHTLAQYPAQLQQAEAFISTSPLKGRTFCQIAGEPPADVWPNVTEAARQWKTLAPNIPLMTTTFGYQPFLDDSIDIWAVNTQVLDTGNNELVLDRAARGQEVWWYVNRFNARPYANFLLDFAPIEHRILFWQTWALGITGVHHWAINYASPEQNPFVDQLDLTPVNGDGFLVYPGPDGPLSSIRWETIRDGIEDFDYLFIYSQYLKQLRQQGGHDQLVMRAMESVDIKAVVPDLTSFSRDPGHLVATRQNLARQIVELARALGR